MATDELMKRKWLKYHVISITGENVRKEKERKAKAICKSLDITKEDFNEIVDYIKTYT